MDRINEKGTTRNRYAKIQPLFNRTNRIQTGNPFNSNHAHRCNELGADSYSLQLDNNIGILALAMNKDTEVTKQQETAKSRSPKIPAASLDQLKISPETNMGEMVKKQKKHKHRKKERSYYAPLLDFKTELLDIMNCILYIMWCPVIFFVRLVLTILTWPAYTLINLFKWIARRGKEAIRKDDSGGSTDIKPEDKPAPDLNKRLTKSRHDFHISADFSAFLREKLEQTKDRESRKEQQSSRRKSVPPLKLVEDTRRTEGKYLQYSSRHQDVSSVESSSDCRSDEHSSRFLESKDCRNKSTRQFQDSVSLAGKKTFLSTLRHSSLKSSRTVVESNGKIEATNPTRKSDLRMKSQELSEVRESSDKNPKPMDLSYATSDRMTDLKNQVIHCYSSVDRGEKLDSCKSSGGASQPDNLGSKSTASGRLQLKPTSLKDSAHGDEDKVEKLESNFENGLEKITAMSEVENREVQSIVAAKDAESCSNTLRKSSLKRINAQGEANLGFLESETVVSKYPEEVPEADGLKTQTGSKPESSSSPVVSKNLEEENVKIGSGDRPTMSKTGISKTAEFTDPIDAKSKWLEMKKKFYGKDYVVAVKEKPEKLEARNLSAIASSSKLPAHKIFQYNMLVGRARQMGAEPPQPEETFVESGTTSSCLTATEANNSRMEPQASRSAAPISRCLSQTRSLSQWPESSYPFKTTKHCSMESKPRPKPRTKGGFSPDRILVDGNVSAMDHLTCARPNSSMSSADVRTPGQNHHSDYKSRMGLKSARLEQKERLVHLSNDETEYQEAHKTVMRNQNERVTENFMGMDTRSLNHRDYQNNEFAPPPMHQLLQNQATPVPWATMARNPGKSNKDANLFDQYAQKIDSLISFCGSR